MNTMNTTPHITKRSAQRGAAMVEGVVVLPIFILLFVGIFYLRDVITEQQQLDTVARSCAFRYAANGCTDIPSGCSADGLLKKGSFESQSDGWVDNQSDAWIEGQEKQLADAIDGAGDGSSAVSDAVWDIVSPILAKAFTNAATATPSSTLKTPGLFGGEEKKMTSHYQLSCNLRPIAATSIALDAWEGIVKK